MIFNSIPSNPACAERWPLQAILGDLGKNLTFYFHTSKFGDEEVGAQARPTRNPQGAHMPQTPSSLAESSPLLARPGRYLARYREVRRASSS